MNTCKYTVLDHYALFLFRFITAFLVSAAITEKQQMSNTDESIEKAAIALQVGSIFQLNLSTDTPLGSLQRKARQIAGEGAATSDDDAVEW